MKKLAFSFALLFAVALASVSVQAQTTGAIAGTVTDSTGAVVPGATVTVKGEAGQEFTATTNSDGVFNIPAVGAGFYTVTVAATNFKTSVVQNVKVDVATPATVNVSLEAGRIDETVVVTSGAEVLQTQTATVGTNIQGRQILETPIQSRDALDLVTLMPGTNTIGTVRTSSINGLPKSALTIQVDGVDVQDNFLKSSDGFFTFIRPRIDAIDEVTVSTSNPGAESSGDGAVAIAFVTRRGTDEYKGTAFWQHRDESLNAANFQNNYSKVAKSKLRLNQFGASFGGPLPFLNFGEGVPWYRSGKGKSYFFVNYERFHLNETSPVRERQVITQEAQNGIFRYGAGGANTVNLFTLAATNPTLATTIDPTVLSMLNTIRAATSTTGSFVPQTAAGIYFRTPYRFANDGKQRRRFLAVRGDLNINKDHALDVIFNDQPFRSNVDFLNSVDPTFPGVTNAGTQNSDRRSLSIGLRSNFGSNVVNQFRYAQLAGWLGGNSRFELVGGTQFWDDTQRGFNIALGSGLTGLTIRNAYSARSSPTRDFTDNVTWIKGNHTFTFGGQVKKVETISDSVGIVRPTVTFGFAGEQPTQDPVMTAVFNATTIPGASTADIANARALYATLTGRILSTTGQAVLEGDGTYRFNGNRHFEIEENTNGLFVQDSWRFRPNLSFTFGVRWQPQLGAKLNSANYSLLENFNMIYDVSGPGNQFSPGTLTGTVPVVRGNGIGDRAFRNDWNNFAPSVGVVWSPEFGSGVMGKIFGTNGTSVIRGGFSRAYIREGTLTVENSIGLHPGGTLPASRNQTSANITFGTFFRTPGNPNLVTPTFPNNPSYPRTLNTADAAFAFAPDFRSGYVDSWSIGYQREINRDTVVEFRYVGNRGKDMQIQYNLNEVNAIENGFGAEFALAQQNLFANIAAGRGVNFRYFGPGTGTNPLPILMDYLGAVGADPSLPASYSSTLWQNATFINQLNRANPAVQVMINTLDFNFRSAATANGRPINFVHNCPTTLGFCFLFDNSEKSWYDAAIVEVRRRMTNGLRFQASYTWAKSFTNAFAAPSSLSTNVGVNDQSNVGAFSLRNRDLDKSYSQIDLRHAFKFDATWDLPFGKGQQFLNSSNRASDAIFGGWSVVPTVRWQSGSPVLMSDIQLVGMTAKELQDAVGVYYNQTGIPGVSGAIPVSYLPADIIANTIRAFSFATPTVANPGGYSTTAGFGAPSGRFIAPAGYGNCQAKSAGECGYRKFVLYGPSFFKVDTAVIKRIRFDEKRNVEMRVTVFDVLNRTNWRLGGWTGNVNNITAFTGSFGQMLNGWAYTDPSGSNDPGGRLVDLMLRINF